MCVVSKTKTVLTLCKEQTFSLTYSVDILSLRALVPDVESQSFLGSRVKNMEPQRRRVRPCHPYVVVCAHGNDGEEG